MATIQTRTAPKLLPVRTVFSGVVNNNARIPWVRTFGSYDEYGIVCLEEDLGNFPAGLYLQADSGNWQFAMSFYDVHKYLVGSDASLDIIYKPTTEYTLDERSVLLVNGKVDDTKMVKFSDYHVYCILSPKPDFTPVFITDPIPGHLIATFTVDGIDMDVNETITEVTVNTTNKSVTIKVEDGSSTNIPASTFRSGAIGNTIEVAADGGLYNLTRVIDSPAPPSLSNNSLNTAMRNRFVRVDAGNGDTDAYFVDGLGYAIKLRG